MYVTWGVKLKSFSVYPGVQVQTPQGFIVSRTASCYELVLVMKGILMEISTF